jgi:hypothetical protein
VNRIVDQAVEREILRLLDRHGASYIRIPFSWSEYCAVGWDTAGIPVDYLPGAGRRYARLSDDEKGRVSMRLYRHKNNYVVNNNGARNLALNDGRKRAKWILPWDGNCFVTSHAWSQLLAALDSHAHFPYFIVPMARVTDNRRLLETWFKPSPRDEPQLVFRSDSRLEFNENYYYGRRPKVELLWRLGVPGGWDYWSIEPWDLPPPRYSDEAGCFKSVSWVARLNSGESRLERHTLTGQSDRRQARVAAVADFLDALDERCRHG